MELDEIKYSIDCDTKLTCIKKDGGEDYSPEPSSQQLAQPRDVYFSSW